MTKFGVAQAVRRVEDIRFITGTGGYSDDLHFDGETYAVVVRSPYAHAKILSVDVDDAKGMPGVLDVITGQDLQDADVKGLPSLWPVKNRDGSKRAEPPHFALAHDKVRHVGDGVAFVVAETLAQAKDAAEAVMVDYEPLDAVSDARKAKADGAPLLHDGAPGNMVFDFENGDEAGTKAAFEKAHKVVRVEVINQRVVANSMEARAAIADYDADADKITLYTPTQGGWGIKRQLAGCLGIEESQVRVITPDVGGGFGMKLFFYPEHILSSFAARKLKRPVRWVSERQEAFLTDTQGRDHWSWAEMAIDENAKFLGLRVHTTANLGGYLSTMSCLIPTAAHAKVLAGVYDVPVMYLDVHGMLTNTTPVDAYRGAGRPEAIYLIERLVNKIAMETGLGPDEVRRRNFIKPEQLPYKTSTGETYDSGEFLKVMERALEESDWNGFDARKAETEAKGLKRGRGICYYVEATAGMPEESAAIRFEEGGKVTVLVGTQSNGQGHETAFTQLICDRLGIDAERISIVMGDTDEIPSGGGTGGSRSLVSTGTAIHAMSDSVIEKGKQAAAQLFETNAVDIEFNDGTFEVAGTDRKIDIIDLAEEAKSMALAGQIETLDTRETTKFNPVTYPNGCHVCEVEVDPETGITTIDRWSVVDDFGNVVNPLFVESQVHGGIAQGVGQAMLEHGLFDDDGQLVAGSFMDYAMPRASDLPNIKFEREVVPCKSNMLGTKGCGEAGCVAGPPALVNGIIDALSDMGVTEIDMPATPQAVWRAIQAAR
ncbi:MAG: xanthine dehydrogenase family protein molybdopterin-binding subunit [Minwuia sp.]|uniref:xanthine dehydrogenase family protein molybdopterin-binding subunit n=1 Tax=Minwuia sp. TaxID=2493630 RepID=UPI003A893763